MNARRCYKLVPAELRGLHRAGWPIQHSETLRNLASGIQQQVAAATAAPTIPPGLTAALSTAQALLNRFHST